MNSLPFSPVVLTRIVWQCSAELVRKPFSALKIFVCFANAVTVVLSRYQRGCLLSFVFQICGRP